MSCGQDVVCFKIQALFEKRRQVFVYKHRCQYSQKSLLDRKPLMDWKNCWLRVNDLQIANYVMLASCVSIPTRSINTGNHC